MTAPFAFSESADALGDALYDVLTEALHLPDYFGRNWDALAEVLGDLSWLAPRRVDRPGAHELVVAFPEADQLAIRRLLV